MWLILKTLGAAVSLLTFGFAVVVVRSKRNERRTIKANESSNTKSWIVPALCLICGLWMIGPSIARWVRRKNHHSLTPNNERSDSGSANTRLDSGSTTRGASSGHKKIRDNSRTAKSTPVSRPQPYRCGVCGGEFLTTLLYNMRAEVHLSKDPSDSGKPLGHFRTDNLSRCQPGVRQTKYRETIYDGNKIRVPASRYKYRTLNQRRNEFSLVDLQPASDQ